MPAFFARVRSLMTPVRERLFKRLFRARFRYDVFISYSHRARESTPPISRTGFPNWISRVSSTERNRRQARRWIRRWPKLCARAQCWYCWRLSGR